MPSCECGAKFRSESSIRICDCTKSVKPRPLPIVNQLPRNLPQWQQDRLAICEACPQLLTTTSECGELKDRGKGCFIWGARGLPNKGARCPLGKWGAAIAPLVPYVQPVEPPKSDRLVITVATGAKFHELLAITRKTFQRYAERIGADYREITDKQYDLWQHEKLRVHEYAKAYDRILFADADCIIRDSCPDLFELVPEDSVGIHDDWQYLIDTDWLPAERSDVGRSQGCQILGDRCLNTGVVVCSRQHADIWQQPPKLLPNTHCSEQIWIEHQIVETSAKTHLLGPEFNTQWWWRDYAERLPNAHIVHLANATNRIELAKELTDEANRNLHVA